jgi:hypothetical protein
MPKHSADILGLAKRGAEARFRELVQETKNLIDLFPHLRDSFDKDELPLSFILAKGAGVITRHGAARRPGRLAATARKPAGDRMKQR